MTFDGAVIREQGVTFAAQGRDRRERTLGEFAHGGRTLKGFHTGRARVQPLQRWRSLGHISQGALLRRDPGLRCATPSG